MSSAAVFTAVRAPMCVRASVSTGSRAPSNANIGASPAQLMSRLDALRRKTRSEEAPRAAPPSPSSATPPHEEVQLSHFTDAHARLQLWWNEHLQDKAALVHATSPHPPAPVPAPAAGPATAEGGSNNEDDHVALLLCPAESLWIRERYPPRPYTERL